MIQTVRCELSACLAAGIEAYHICHCGWRRLIKTPDSSVATRNVVEAVVWLPGLNNLLEDVLDLDAGCLVLWLLASNCSTEYSFMVLGIALFQACGNLGRASFCD